MNFTNFSAAMWHVGRASKAELAAVLRFMQTSDIAECRHILRNQRVDAIVKSMGPLSQPRLAEVEAEIWRRLEDGPAAAAVPLRPYPPVLPGRMVAIS